MILAFEKSVGGIIYRMKNEQPVFLLLHYHSGHWDFVKGHQEEGENDEETLKRETEEETGITDLEIMPKFKKQVRFFYSAKGREREKRIQNGIGTKIWKRVIYYGAETQTEKVKLSFEHIGFEWLDYEKALERITFQNSKNVLNFFWPKIKKQLEKK